MNKNKQIKYIFIMLIIQLLICYLAVNAALIAIAQFNVNISYIPIDNTFTYSNNGSITGHTPGSTHVIIPTMDNNGNVITKIDNFAINNDQYMEVLEIPETIESLGWLNLMNCRNLKVIILYADDPITEYLSILGLQLSASVKIYVPDETLNMYKDSWYNYRAQIYKYSEYNN